LVSYVDRYLKHSAFYDDILGFDAMKTRRYQRFGETSVYIFRAKVVMLESERIYVGSEEGKAGGMDQSEPNEQYRLPHCRENLTSYMFILLVNALIGNAK
jgi:hypothetical protein